jgi:hypothetical protein
MSKNYPLLLDDKTLPTVVDQLFDRSRSVTRQVVDKNLFCFTHIAASLAL